MDYEITLEELNQLSNAADLILQIVGHVQGRADTYAARRDEIKIIRFEDIKKSPYMLGGTKKKKGKFTHTVEKI